MTCKRQQSIPSRFNPYEHGAREYGREDVSDIPGDGVTMDILQEALDVHSYNHRKENTFNAHPDNKKPLKPYLKLELPEGVDPGLPVLQLASAGIRSFGFGSVLSINTVGSMDSWRNTDLMAEWVSGVATRHSPDTGAILLLERSEDADNPRLKRLQARVSTLAVPRLAIVTTAAPQGAPPCEQIVLEPGMLKPDDMDPGPGMDML